jgi:putative sterol carrier protein
MSESADPGDGGSTPAPFPSEQWIRAWKRQLNDNEDYAVAAEGWGADFDGDFVFEVRPDAGYDGDPVVFHVSLEDGRCLDARVVDGESEYGFALRADYADWRRVIEGDLDATAVATGSAFDVEGSKLTVMRYAEAAAEMVRTATTVDTEFRD